MYNNNDKYFIQKDSNGNIAVLWANKRNGLCRSILSRRGAWSEPSILYANVHGPICAALSSSDDRSHVLFQTASGTVMLSVFKNFSDRGSFLPLLNTKAEVPGNRQFELAAGSSIDHVFYTVPHNAKFLLTHQIVSSTSVSSPTAIDYLPDNTETSLSRPYRIITASNGSDGKVHLLYVNQDNTIGFREFIASKSAFGSFIPISKKYCSNPDGVYIEQGGDIHTIFNKKMNDTIELTYIKVDKSFECSEPHVVASSKRGFDNASILLAGDQLIVFWVWNENIYYSTSPIDALNWQKPLKYDFDTDKQFTCISYQSNHPTELGNVIAKELPANLTGSLKMAFIGPGAGKPITTPTGKPITTPNEYTLNEQKPMDLGKMILETLESMKNSIDTLHKTALEYSVWRNNIDIEINKLIIRLEQLERTLERINKKDPECRTRYFDTQQRSQVGSLNQFQPSPAVAPDSGSDDGISLGPDVNQDYTRP